MRLVHARLRRLPTPPMRGAPCSTLRLRQVPEDCTCSDAGPGAAEVGRRDARGVCSRRASAHRKSLEYGTAAGSCYCSTAAERLYLPRARSQRTRRCRTRPQTRERRPRPAAAFSGGGSSLYNECTCMCNESLHTAFSAAVIAAAAAGRAVSRIYKSAQVAPSPFRCCFRRRLLAVHLPPG